MISASELQIYLEQGYLVVPGLFSSAEVQQFIQHYMAMHDCESAAQNQSLGDASSVGANDNDPLKVFPRLMQMHRRDAASMDWLLDARLNACLTALLGREPYAVQTMLYFKPPRARGQWMTSRVGSNACTPTPASVARMRASASNSKLASSSSRASVGSRVYSGTR